MKYFAWDAAKNAKLRKVRGIGFEEIAFHIERGDLLDILEHPIPASRLVGAGDPHARARLLHEARAAASLNHHISARFMM